MYLWTVKLTRWRPIPEKKKKQLLKETKGTGRSWGDTEGDTTFEHYVAEDIRDVWEKLERELLDEGVEVESIIREVPVLSVLKRKEEQEELAGMYRGGNFGYGNAKKMLLEKIDETFSPYREERKRLGKDTGYVTTVLAEGGARARAEAQETMRLVREAAGLGAMPIPAAELLSAR